MKLSPNSRSAPARLSSRYSRVLAPCQVAMAWLKWQLQGDTSPKGKGYLSARTADFAPIQAGRSSRGRLSRSSSAERTPGE